MAQVGGIYNLPDASGRAMGAQRGAAATTAAMQKAPYKPEKTAGGAITSAGAGAVAGAPLGWYGAAGGAVVGFVSYYLS